MKDCGQRGRNLKMGSLNPIGVGWLLTLDIKIAQLKTPSIFTLSILFYCEQGDKLRDMILEEHRLHLQDLHFDYKNHLVLSTDLNQLATCDYTSLTRKEVAGTVAHYVCNVFVCVLSRL